MRTLGQRCTSQGGVRLGTFGVGAGKRPMRSRPSAATLSQAQLKATSAGPPGLRIRQHLGVPTGVQPWRPSLASSWRWRRANSDRISVEFPCHCSKKGAKGRKTTPMP